MVEGKLRLLSQCSSAFLTAINGAISKLTTTNWLVQEDTGVLEAKRSTTGDASFAIWAKGSGKFAQLDIWNTQTASTGNETTITATDADTQIYVQDGAAGGANTPILQLAADDGVKSATLTLKPDGQLIMPSKVIFSAANFFVSAEITGNGAAQNTAHSLGRTPVIAIAYFTDVAVAGDTLSAVTSDGTNCTVTCSNGSKYRILAF